MEKKYERLVLQGRVVGWKEESQFEILSEARDQDKSQTRRSKEACTALLYIAAVSETQNLKTKGLPGPESSVVASYCCILHATVVVFSPNEAELTMILHASFPLAFECRVSNWPPSYLYINLFFRYIYHYLSTSDITHFTN